MKQPNDRAFDSDLKLAVCAPPRQLALRVTWAALPRRLCDVCPASDEAATSCYHSLQSRLLSQLVRQQSAYDAVQTDVMAKPSSLKVRNGVQPEVRWSCRIQHSRTYLPANHARACVVACSGVPAECRS